MFEKHPALFLDRDGVINVDKGYVVNKKDFEFIHGIFSLLKNYQDKGYKLIIITNQSGIGRGFYTNDDFNVLNNWMLNRFEKGGIFIDDVYYCPDLPESNSNDRKPAPGMFLKAIKKHNIDVKESIMIGDKVSDMQAAYSAGINKRIIINNTDKKYSTHQFPSIGEIK